MHFDDLILKQYIEKIGCRAPYHKPFKDIPLCDTNTKMKNYYFLKPKQNLAEMFGKYEAPCQRISDFDYKVEKTNYSLIPRSLSLYIINQDKIKVITQSRLVDIQSLIGYIGGYVGLFLGKKGNLQKQSKEYLIYI